MKYLSRFILWLSGWKAVGKFPEAKKFIVVCAPHTSMWDFVIGRLYYFSVGLKPCIMIKKELFFFPLGPVLRWLGGIPVERQKKTNIVEQVVDQINKSDKFLLTITPEGTRKKVKKWKTGFYQIATKANIPVLLGYFDYTYKVIGIGDLYYLTEDVEHEMRKAKLYFKDIHPRHPEKFTIGDVQ